MAKRMKARARMASAAHMLTVTAPSGVTGIVLEAVREARGKDELLWLTLHTARRTWMV